jgi:hypothetical protein
VRNTDTLTDPSSFHLSNSTSENPVIDPVLITSQTQFFLNDNFGFAGLGSTAFRRSRKGDISIVSA